MLDLRNEQFSPLSVILVRNSNKNFTKTKSPSPDMARAFFNLGEYVPDASRSSVRITGLKCYGHQRIIELRSKGKESISRTKVGFGYGILIDSIFTPDALDNLVQRGEIMSELWGSDDQLTSQHPTRPMSR